MSRDWNVPEAPYEHRSVCVVQPMNGYNTWMKRLADITAEGIVRPFFQNKNEPSCFDNRDMLYRKDGADQMGTVGVWDWYAEPNRERAWEDYVHCRHVQEIAPVEIYIVPSCYDVDDLISRLKDGIYFEPSVDRFLLCCSHGNQKYSGLLLSTSLTMHSDGKVMPADRVTFLPQYDFTQKDDVQLANERRYLNTIDPGIPTAKVPVKKIHEIVRSSVLNEISWKKLKARNATRDMQQKFKEFLSYLSGTDLVKQISVAGQISEEKAAAELRSFIAHAEAYIDGASIEDEVLAASIKANRVLQERCKALVAAAWEEENRGQIRIAQGVLTEKEEACRSAEERLVQQRAELKDLADKKEDLSSAVAEQEKLAAEVEQHVAARIRRAREDAAAFLAETAFFPSPAVIQGAAHGAADYRVGEPVDELYRNEDWHQTLDALETALATAGVSHDIARDFAAYLYAAYMLHLPVLIAGSNADPIADALSVSLCGKTCGRLRCTGDFDETSLEVAHSGSDEVIRLENPFAHEWRSFLPSILANRDKCWIAVHPFSEDLQLEPQGLSHYFLPICTEFFVDHAAEHHSVGGYRAENYGAFPIVEKVDRNSKKALSLFPMTPLLSQNMGLVLTNMDALLGNKGASDAAILFALLPYAYVRGQIEKMKELVADKTLTLSDKSLKLLRWLIGDLS